MGGSTGGMHVCVCVGLWVCWGMGVCVYVNVGSLVCVGWVWVSVQLLEVVAYGEIHQMYIIEIQLQGIN